MLQNANPLRKSAPWPPNISDEDVSCTAPATENASLQILFRCPTPAIVFWRCYKTLTFCSLLTRCTIPCACHANRHPNVQNLSEHVVIFNILTSKCASRHVHFFHISTSKSGPSLVCFCAFWLGNVLRATTACSFSSLIWPDGSAPAALASILSTLRRHKSLEKHSVLRLSYLFVQLDLLSSETFFFLVIFLLLYSTLLHSTLPYPTLLYSSLLCSSLLWLFPSLLFICPYCRKFGF